MNCKKPMFLKPLHFCSAKIIPLVFDNSLSYYEQLCAFTAKLNSVIDYVNSMSLGLTEFYQMLNSELACGETALQERGAGTEQLEEELREAFPDRVVARFDADTTESKANEEMLIRDFAEGRIDILVGTQMITKGFDFERLALTVIVRADSLFAVPDFRSDERAFQLLTQLMGRSGRRGEQGRLVIQTDQPEHPVIQRLLHPEQESVNATDLLAERKAFNYPPYVRMICITVKDRYEGRVWNVCRLIREAAEAIGIADIAGPVTPPVDVVAGDHIAQFWIKLPRNRALAATKKALYAQVDRIDRDFKGHTTIQIDVDPM